MVWLEQHFDTAFDAPDGIKKLRGLILALAVQGKLVTQDPNAQPASELLKQIETEKKRLVKEGKIKKPKVLEKITVNDAPYMLPNGWEWARLGDIAEYIQRGKGPKYSETPSIPVISQKCIQWSGFNKKVVRFIEPSTLDKYKDERFILPGDLLWNSTGTGTIGRINIYKNELSEYEKVVADSHVTVVRLVGLCNDFVLKYLMSPYVQSAIEDNSSGTTNQIELNTSTVNNQIIPIPPLEEQQRIVAKIDQLMARCDELEKLRDKRNVKRLDVHTSAIKQLLNAQGQKDFSGAWQFITTHFGELYSVQENVAELRKAILQLAVMGKLVPQDPNDQPARELLKEIEAEKQRLVKEKKFKKPKPLLEIKPEEIPYELPHGWEWVRLGNAISHMDAGWSPKCENGPASDMKWGVLKTTAVQTLKFWPHENKALPEKLDPRPDAQVEENDILITRAGPKNRVGICCVAKSVRPRLMLSDKIIRFKIFGDLIFSDFCALGLVIGCGADQIEKMKSGMADSQMNISQNKIKQVVIALPPLPEQKRITAQIDQLMVLCDMLEKQIDSATNKKSELLNAVMSQV